MLHFLNIKQIREKQSACGCQLGMESWESWARAKERFGFEPDAAEEGPPPPPPAWDPDARRTDVEVVQLEGLDPQPQQPASQPQPPEQVAPSE